VCPSSEPCLTKTKTKAMTQAEYNRQYREKMQADPVRLAAYKARQAARDKARHERTKADPNRYAVARIMMKVRQGRYRQRHPDRVREEKRVYAINHREECNARASRYNKQKRRAPEHLIMVSYRSEVNRLRWFDEQNHWRNHPVLAAPWTKEKSRRNIEAFKARVQCDPAFRFLTNIRRRVRTAMEKSGVRPSYTVQQAEADLGCPVAVALTHIASLFKPGMNWNNWSLHGWHLDHVEPLSSFDLSDPAQVRKACHISNLQPLWSRENYIKRLHEERDLPSRHEQEGHETARIYVQQCLM
jgi:hypothetical protein